MKHEKPDLPPYAKIRQMNRGGYDKELANEILDAGLVAHCGFIHEGRPMVIPMVYARIGDKLYIHGASTTRIIKDNKAGVPASLEVTLLDGLVFGRSAFHHSMNFRCVIVHGTARLVEDLEEKNIALAAITDHMAPGRWAECREMLPKELKATGVLVLDVEHVSTKVRTGPPVDDPIDIGTDIWAGIVPVATGFGQPYAAADVPDGIEPPASIRAARQKFA
jgi:nitroimidazol reductase NimA-like FMN-containing flavoprotein (pyridoxamine 5'-phosphate oxidase superfamily)